MKTTIFVHGLEDVDDLSRDGVATMRRIGRDMKTAADRAAAEERRTHRYKNRTWRLEGSTFGLGPLPGSDEVTVELGARMPYASYVENRGYSRITQLCEETALELEYHFDAEAERLARR